MVAGAFVRAWRDLRLTRSLRHMFRNRRKSVCRFRSSVRHALRLCIPLARGDALLFRRFLPSVGHGAFQNLCVGDYFRYCAANFFVASAAVRVPLNLSGAMIANGLSTGVWPWMFLKACRNFGKGMAWCFGCSPKLAIFSCKWGYPCRINCSDL